MGFYSQFGEDQWISGTIKLPDQGIFVDVGAEDGVRFSDTLHFEENGWKGVCIEPDSRCSEDLLAKRSCQKVLGAAGYAGQRRFRIHPLLGLSGAFASKGDFTRVSYRPLSEILKDNSIGEIDLLTIDVEGAESEVWDTLDLALHKPKIVIMEYWADDIGFHQETLLTPLLAQDGYVVAKKTAANLIFVRK